MNADELLEQARQAVSGRRVYGDAIQQDGTIVIPAARVAGAGGGGAGHDEDGQEGLGGGFGLRARPVGAFVIEGGRVTWRPVVDIDRLVTQVVGLAVAVLCYRWRVAAMAARRDAAAVSD